MSYIISSNRSRKDSSFISESHFEVGMSHDSPAWNQIYDLVRSGNFRTTTEEMADLFEIALLVSIADRVFLRGEREEWIRSFIIKTNLRNGDLFNRHLKGDLEIALNILGGDNITFEVSNITDPSFSIKTIQFNDNEKSKSRQEKLSAASVIALMSGGQDSSIGAIEYFKAQKSPLFVRINTRDKANPPKQLRSTVRKYRCPYFYFNFEYANFITGTEIQTEKSQRLRSFFFLSLASLMAKMLNKSEVNINENGIMAIHLPLDPSRASTFSTRTAYPPYLSYLESIIKRWLGFSDFTIGNNFVLKTKKEVIEIARDNNLLGVAKNSVSCAHSATVSLTAKHHKKKAHYLNSDFDGKHCGYCFPCLLRRISMQQAGLKDHDVVYLVDPFGSLFFDSDSKDFDFIHESKSAVLSTIRFARFFLNSSRGKILQSYPQLYEVSGLSRGQLSIDDLISLHVRFATEIRNYIEIEAPYLLFLFDEKLSEQTDTQVRELASIDFLKSFLKLKGVKSYNEYFIEELEKMYSSVRFKILIALGNKRITPEEAQSHLMAELESYLPKRKSELEKLNLNKDSGREIGRRASKSCNCPPFTGA